MTPSDPPAADPLGHRGDKPADAPPRRRRGLSLAVSVVVVTSAAAAWWHWGNQAPDVPAAPRTRSDPGARPRPDFAARASPVTAVAARQGPIDVYLTALGTVTPRNIVIVRPRVDGQLLRVAFREGQMVKAGDLLAEIDPRPFQVQLAQATGQMARNSALLRNAQIDLERYRTLLGQDSISRQQVDTQEALVAQYRGAVQSDQGQVDNAKLQLDYARVTAPISGRVGLRQVDAGNVVRASDANGLVVIAQLQPITVVFPIPEDKLPRLLKRMQTGVAIPVQAFDRDQKLRLATGRLITLDNQIDLATGTVKLKAEFANADLALFPNQFVNIRLQVEIRPEATLVPTAAIQRGAPGTFVYRVQDDRTVTVVPVKLGPAGGEVTAVDSGVAPGDLVVVDGTDRLREGAKVELITRDGQAAPGGARRGAGKAARPPGAPAQGQRPAGGPPQGEGPRRSPAQGERPAGAPPPGEGPRRAKADG